MSYNFYGKNIKALIKSKGITYTQLANKCGISYQYMLNIMCGQKPLYLELLNSIKTALDLTLEETCALVVDSKMSAASNEKNGILAYIAMRKDVPSDKKESYKLPILYSKDNMKQKYGEFDDDNFRTLVVKDVIDSYYRDEFQKFESDSDENGNMLQQIRYQLENNECFTEIMELLLNTTDKKLKYLKETIKFYIEYHNS